MPYLQLDLDAKRRIPAAANAAGMSPGQMLWGLAEIWEECWRSKAGVVSVPMLAGYFAADGERVARALEFFGFAERVGPDTVRVKGAERYLRISKARSDAGKKGAAAKHGAGNCQANGEESEEFAKQLPGKDVALSSSIEQQSPNTDSKAKDPTPPSGQSLAPKSPVHPSRAREETPASAFAGIPTTPEMVQAIADRRTAERRRTPLVYAEPTAPPEAWGWRDFFAWFQFLRQDAGLVGEPEARGGGAWFSEAMMSLNGDIEALQDAVEAYGADKFWQARGVPFAGFMSQWHKYVPRREGSDVDAQT